MQAVAQPSAARGGDATAERLFRISTAIFVAAFLFHNADHIRRGVGVLSGEVIGAGTLLSVGTVIAVALVLLRHPLAPLVAVAVGVPGAIGVFATHVLPTWSAFSDSFSSLHVDGISWAAGISEIVALALFAAAGANLLRVRSASASA